MEARQYICDRMVGKLARHLRMLGLDAPLVMEPPPGLAPNQILLTRRRKLEGLPGVLFITQDRLPDQLRQVMEQQDITPIPAHFFSRCVDCNQPVHPVRREDVWGKVPDYTYHNAPGFTQCPECKKVFWPGSHGDRARDLLQAILSGSGQYAG